MIPEGQVSESVLAVHVVNLSAVWPCTEGTRIAGDKD
jgi:hypothetical protein